MQIANYMLNCNANVYIKLNFCEIYNLLTQIFRLLDSEDEETESEDITSIEASELKSEFARACDASVYNVPMSLPQDTSMLLLSQPLPVRERGHSLCVERTTDLLHPTPEPRSKSLRLKRNQKDVSK